MNMKKVLAVLLAVMMAVSAMAITAFAEDYTIPLYKNLPSTFSHTKTVTLTIPVYATYGYFTEGAYFVLENLPTRANIWGGWGNMDNVTWKVNGYKLQENAATAKVYFGHVAHDYIPAVVDEATGDVIVPAYETVIPVDTTVNGTTTVVLTAEIKSDSEWNWAMGNPDAFKNFTVNGAPTSVQFFTAADELIAGSASTIKFWNPAVSGANNTATHNMTFVNAISWTDIITNPDKNVLKDGAKVWNWDHNLNNKAAILGAETAKLVVKLDKAINGRAIYTLWATNESNALYETNSNWWAYDATRTLVSTVVLDGSATELVFEVPLDVLYDTAYGVWNGQFAITEEITLTSEVLEKDPTSDNYLVDIDDALWGVGTFPDASESGDLTWNRWWGADGFSGAKYKGASIVYAADGQAHIENNNDVDVAWNAKLSGAMATDIYLLLSSADDTVVEEVEDPVEPSTDEEEDVTVDVEEPAVEENPKTGLVLAVVPMLVAAAAVVASKRR